MHNRTYYKDTEYRIVGELLKTPLESKSMHEIAITTGTMYATTHKIIPQLVKIKILTEEKKGNSHQISVNLEDAQIDDLTGAMLQKKKDFLKKHFKIGMIINEMEESLSEMFYCLVIFGSYAKGNYNSKSDIDFLVIIPDSENKENYSSKINRLLQLHPSLKVDMTICTVKEFLEMLNEKYTVGREAFIYGLPVCGIEHYYKIVKQYVRTKGY